ncbi:DUF2515 family protein [Bacillus fonticola]|uniref:DUF2515 family protein n=1 Tax=Bacillus fonticola TaxID=2728853 RepID=UPI0014766366|nr:DUF2515 family protein [Bacillus fonticola]
MNKQRVQHLISSIHLKTARANLDNISRTKAYQAFYNKYREIPWSFLASMVSRNAGWSMTDLQAPEVISFLPAKLRRNLFLVYERANWLIFQDAYPQLLLYHYSTKWGVPLFQLLSQFRVSTFMEEEWRRFWREGNQRRLLYAQIVNEQLLIQQPVLHHAKKEVFGTLPFFMEDHLHYSLVVFPTTEGKLYGTSVSKFTDPNERIQLGKRLCSILFHDNWAKEFVNFASRTEPTGSRYEYEQYLPIEERRHQTSQLLRACYPVVHHHILEPRLVQWEGYSKPPKDWATPPQWKENPHITHWSRAKWAESRMWMAAKEAVLERRRQKKNDHLHEQ